MDESKYKGQDKYCVSCDISAKKDYASVVIIHDDLKITKSELVKHCEEQIKKNPKNSIRYKTNFLLLCFLSGITLDEVNKLIDGKREKSIRFTKKNIGEIVYGYTLRRMPILPVRRY